MIQPVKVEVVYPDPKIYIIRDLLSDNEMNRLKELAAPKVSRIIENGFELGMAR